MQPSQTDIAYDQIEERIITLTLPPGAELSEGTLVETLGIGRTPVREALQRLAREGLVIVVPRRGILVSDIDAVQQLELVAVRKEIERLMARLAGTRATDAERAAFREIAAGMRSAASAKDALWFMRHDQELNLLMATACRNPYIKKAMDLTRGLSRRFWFAHHRHVLDLPLCARLHAELAEAISSGSKQLAAKASDNLMEYIEDFTRAAIDVRVSHQPQTGSGK